MGRNSKKNEAMYKGIITNYKELSKRQRNCLMPENAPNGLSKEDYVKYFSPAGRECKSSALICYICIGLSALLELFNAISFVEIIMLVVYGLLILCAVFIQAKQSKACAIIITVYSVLNTLLSVVFYGKLYGWWLVLAGVYAISGTFKFVSEYKDYKSGYYNSEQ